jgi:hypothetical protein
VSPIVRDDAVADRTVTVKLTEKLAELACLHALDYGVGRSFSAHTDSQLTRALM